MHMYVYIYIYTHIYVYIAPVDALLLLEAGVDRDRGEVAPMLCYSIPCYGIVDHGVS